MSILDDARRLADMSPDGDDGSGDTVCVYCLADHYIRDGAAFTRADDVQHAPDCPWLSMPKIVEALEAADLLIKAWDEHIQGANSGSDVAADAVNTAFTRTRDAFRGEA